MINDVLILLLGTIGGFIVLLILINVVLDHFENKNNKKQTGRGVKTIPDPSFPPPKEPTRLIKEEKLDECEKCKSQFILPVFDKDKLIGYICRDCNYHKYFYEKYREGE